MKILFFLIAVFVACQAYNVNHVDKDELIREIENELDNDERVQLAKEDNVDVDDPEENETEENDPKPLFFRLRRALRRIRIRIRGRRIWNRIGKPAVCAYKPWLCPIVRG